MSPSRTNTSRMALTIASDSIVAVTQSGEKAMRFVVPLADVAERDAITQEVQRALARIPVQGLLDITVTSHWLHYAVVTLPHGLRDVDEANTFAGQSIAGLVGLDLDKWEINICDPKPGESRLACAAPRGLLDGVRMSAAQAGCPILSLVPAIVPAFNKVAGDLPPDFSGALLFVEPGIVNFFSVVAGAWRRHRAFRLPSQKISVPQFITEHAAFLRPIIEPGQQIVVIEAGDSAEGSAPLDVGHPAEDRPLIVAFSPRDDVQSANPCHATAAPLLTTRSLAC